MLKLSQILKEILKEEREWIIWGIPPGKSDEEILFTKARSSGEAKKVVDILTKKHGCKKVRVQTIDVSKDTDFSKEFGKAVREADSPTTRTRRYNRKNRAKVRQYLKSTQDDRVARNSDRAKAEKRHGKAAIKNKDIHHPNGPQNGGYKIVKKDHGPDKKNEHVSNEAIAMNNVPRDMRNQVKGVEKLPKDTQKWLMGLIYRYGEGPQLPTHHLNGYDLGFIRGILQKAERSGVENLTKIRFVRTVLGTEKN